MNSVESWFNQLNDWDLTWFGFRNLKPAKTDFMPMRTVLILSAFYAPIATILTVMSCLLLAEMFELDMPTYLLWAISAFSALSFLSLQSMSAMFWNRRARRLKQS